MARACCESAMLSRSRAGGRGIVLAEGMSVEGASTVHGSRSPRDADSSMPPIERAEGAAVTQPRRGNILATAEIRPRPNSVVKVDARLATHAFRDTSVTRHISAAMRQYHALFAHEGEVTSRFRRVATQPSARGNATVHLAPRLTSPQALARSSPRSSRPARLQS